MVKKIPLEIGKEIHQFLPNEKYKQYEVLSAKYKKMGKKLYLIVCCNNCKETINRTITGVIMKNNKLYYHDTNHYLSTMWVMFQLAHICNDYIGVK